MMNTRSLKEWLSHYPECTQTRQQVAVDCTPGYFGSKVAPPSIAWAYKQAHHKMVFMVFLREPMVRSHAHYYHYKDNGVLNGAFSGCTPQQFPRSFPVAVEHWLSSGSVCDCDCDAMFQDSLYAFSFARYFDHFNATRFHVVPFQYAISSDVVKYTWDILNVEQGTGNKDNFVGVENEKIHHDYKALEEDVTVEMLQQFRNIMDELTGAEIIAQILAGSGAHLYGFDHENHTEDGNSVTAWLSDNW